MEGDATVPAASTEQVAASTEQVAPIMDKEEQKKAIVQAIKDKKQFTLEDPELDILSILTGNLLTEYGVRTWRIPDINTDINKYELEAKQHLVVTKDLDKNYLFPMNCESKSLDCKYGEDEYLTVTDRDNNRKLLDKPSYYFRDTNGTKVLAEVFRYELLNPESNPNASSSEEKKKPWQFWKKGGRKNSKKHKSKKNTKQKKSKKQRKSRR